MADIRWIKVAVDMFEDSKIEFLRSLPEGDSIIVTWLQMLSIAGQSNMGGYLMVTDGIPYTEQLLSNKLRRNPVFMQFALQTLAQLKMVNVEDGPFHITNWEKHQNVDGMDKIRLQTKTRVQKHREKGREKLNSLPGNATVTLHVTQNVTHDVTHCNATELELEIDKDIKDKDMVPRGTKFNPPSVEEVKAYCEERENGIDAEYFVDSHARVGWKLKNGLGMKDWKATVRTWEKFQNKNGKSTIGKTGKAARMPDNFNPDTNNYAPLVEGLF